MTAFDRLRLTGTPYERGVTHGEEFADEIESNVEIYLRRFEQEGLSPAAVRDRAAEFVDLIESENEDYTSEIRGIADGSGVSITDVTMLNVRWEVIYTAWKEEYVETDGDSAEPEAEAEPPADGCTSFGVTPEASADGKTYMGQNWDWLAPVADNLFVMDVMRDGKPDFLAMTEAGIAGGKIGVNEHGIGLSVNGLISPDDGTEPHRKPLHVRFREVLDAGRFDAAIAPIVEQRRTCSANVVIGHADGEVLDLETAPETFDHLHPEDGILTHANHFETDAIESVAERRGPSTLYRAFRLRKHLSAHAGEIDPEIIASGLRDHFGNPASVCSHVDESLPEIERGQTNASFVIDLDERRLLGARGPPCEHDYHEYRLSS